MVSFMGEGASDAGGPYRESLDNLCEELSHSPALAILIPTPNKTQNNATDKGKQMLNPSASSKLELQLCELLGALMGLCLRTQSPLPFYLSVYTWKLLLGETPSLVDLRRAYHTQDSHLSLHVVT